MRGKWVKGLTRQGQEGRKVGPEGGFVTSLVENICPAPIVQSLAQSTVYGDTLAMASTSTRRFNNVIYSKEREVCDCLL
jgi:hypothetical protein